jgi:hypothetical protein
VSHDRLDLIREVAREVEHVLEAEVAGRDLDRAGARLPVVRHRESHLGVVLARSGDEGALGGSELHRHADSLEKQT